MVLAPRELAVQIATETREFGWCMEVQSRELDRRCDIWVATPGRLLDFMNRGRISLSLVHYVV